MTMADDDVLLDIDVVELSREGLRHLESTRPTPQTEWYHRRRREALAAAGLVGAFNPMQPRGRDGKWIEMLGWVRWLDDGKWKRGRVTDIDKDGNSTVTETTTGQKRSFDRFQARQKLYTTAKTKATLELPNPAKNATPDGFTKIGGQSGSNPGGLYKVTKPDSVKGQLAITPDMLKQALRAEAPGTMPSKLDVNDFDSAATVMGKIPADSFIVDNSSGKTYTRLGNLLWDNAANEVTPVANVFGDENSARRATITGNLDVYTPSTPVSNVLQAARAQGVNRPEQGTQFYVKSSKSSTHAHNEALANDLYEMAGVSVPNVSVGKSGDTIASEILTGDSITSLSQSLGDPKIMEQIRQDFVIDAWLANWDAAGTGLDNILIVDGQPYRVDAGGALLFRAMGSPKGNKFGNEVTELDSLRNPAINPDAAKVFGSVTAGELHDGAQRLAAISPKDIVDAVEAQGFDSSMSDKLIARRKYILDKYAVKEPSFDVPVPEIAAAPESVAPPIDLANSHWSVADKALLPGKTNINDQFAVLDLATTAPSMSGTAIVNDFQAGNTPLITEHGALWEVTDVSPHDGGDPTKYRLLIREPGTGDTKNKTVGVGLEFGYVGDEAAAVLPVYKDRIGAAQDYRVSNYRTLDDVAIAQSIGSDSIIKGIPTKPVMTLDEPPAKGKWVITGDISYPYAFKVDHVTSDGVYHGTSIEGVEMVPQKPNYSWRVGVPGSMFDNALEAIKARDAEAAKQDAAAKTDLPPTSVTKTDAQMAIGGPNVTTSSATDVVEATPVYFDPETGVNKSLNVVGEPVELKSLTAEDADNWVGKTVFLQQIEQKGKNFSSYVGMVKVTSVSSNGTIGTVDATGFPQNNSPYNMQMFEIDNELAPIVNLQFKKDYTIALNGTTIGTWTKNDTYYHSYYDKYRAKLNPEFSATGKDFNLSVGGKDQLRRLLTPMIVPPGVTGSKPKSEKSISLEKAVRMDTQFGAGANVVTEAGSADTLLDGAKVSVGMWVISKTDGKIGQVSVIESGTGYVKVKMDDGSIKGRAASTLSAATDPSTGAIPAYSPLYKDVKLADGSNAFPSQGVLVGDASATIVMIKPDGSVRIVDKDGKFTWTSAKKLTPAKSFAPAMQTDLDSSPALAAPMNADHWKVAPKPGKIPYGSGIGGTTTIPQTSNAVEIYREFAHTRKLTRDGFVPRLGMIVRDDKGEQLMVTRIAATYDGNPSMVWTIPVGNPYANPTGRQPSRLWVDHVAELSTVGGTPLPKISGLHFSSNDKGVSLPTGTVLYKYKKSSYIGGRYVSDIETYVAALPDGTFRNIVGGGLSSPGSNLSDIKGFLVGKPEKIAYIDELSETMMTFDSAATYVGGSKEVITDAWIHSTAEGSLEQLKQEIYQKKLDAGIIEPEKFEGSQAHLITLPKPSTAPSNDDPAATQLPPPTIVATPERLRGAPVVGNSYTVESGIAKLQEKIAAGGPGSHTVYAMGDSDYIEDMALRIQSTVDPQGNDYVEVRFRLLENKIDDLATRVIQPETAKFGDWNHSGTFYPGDLSAGDAISVRISTAGALKPDENSYRPNATVVGTPKKVGVSTKGLDAYEVQIALAGGTVGKIVIEQRSSPSVKKFEWDPLKPLPTGTFNGVVSPEATKLGWSTFKDASVGYESLGDGKTMIDDKGRKMFDINNPKTVSLSAHSGAKRLQFNGRDGAVMLVQATHPSSEERQSTIHHNGANKAIRASSNGEVTIRVRVDDPNGLSKISEMMSAAGIPAEAQGQPTGNALRRMALNKVAKQLAPTYSHMKRPQVTGEDDESAAGVLKMIDTRFGVKLGRSATMNDIMIRTTPEGRVQVVFSDDVARAISETSGYDYAYHSFSYGGGSFKEEVLASPVGTGLMSTDERWSQGILISGASSKTDVGNDAANRVFFRTAKGKSSNLSGDNMLFISGLAISKLVDSYFSPGDHFGRRGSSNGQQYNNSSIASNNELMIKRKIDPEQFGFVMVGSESARQSRLKSLKAAGVTNIGGRPIEDVIVVSGSKSVTDLGELGMVIGTEVPITSIPGAPA